jgi:hypothetical protein
VPAPPAPYPPDPPDPPARSRQRVRPRAPALSPEAEPQRIQTPGPLPRSHRQPRSDP